jgi:hypothetical protein
MSMTGCDRRRRTSAEELMGSNLSSLLTGVAITDGILRVDNHVTAAT